MKYLNYQTFMDDLLATIGSHQQINTIHTGLISDISTPKVKPTQTEQNNIIYPYAFLINQSIDIEQNEGSSLFYANMTLILMDRYNDNETSIYQIQSNMFEIARDIIAFYSIRNGGGKPYRLYANDVSINIHPFVERGSENVAGVELTLPFMVESPLSNSFPQMT